MCMQLVLVTHNNVEFYLTMKKDEDMILISKPFNYSHSLLTSHLYNLFCCLLR